MCYARIIKAFQYVIEMQVARESGFTKRAQFYAARAYTSQMQSGDRYEILKKVIFLAFTNFILFPEKKDTRAHIASWIAATIRVI